MDGARLVTVVDHVFDSRPLGIRLSGDFLSSGESPEDDVAYTLTCRALADSATDDHRHVLPHDLETIPPGPFLSVVVSSVDRTRLNGHDAVRLMQAEARLAASHEAGKLATMVEVAMMRHRTPWMLTRRAADDHIWTSPLGHTYLTKRGPPS